MYCNSLWFDECIKYEIQSHRHHHIIYIYEDCCWSNERKANILKSIGLQMNLNLVFRFLLFHMYTCALHIFQTLCSSRD